MQLIGFCEIKKEDKKGNIVLAMPFFPKTDLFLMENNKKEKENSPDFILFFSKIKVGALWKNKFEKDGETRNYLSGNFFTAILPENKISIVIFEDKIKKREFGAVLFFGLRTKKRLKRICQQRKINLIMILKFSNGLYLEGGDAKTI